MKTVSVLIRENDEPAYRVEQPADCDDGQTAAVSAANAVLAERGWPIGLSSATLVLATGDHSAGPPVDVYRWRGELRGVDLEVIVGVRRGERK